LIDYYTRADKLLEILSSQLGVDAKSTTEMVQTEVLKKYESLYKGLEAATVDEKAFDGVQLDSKLKEALVELAKKNIKPPYVEVTGFLEMRSYKPDGVTTIKESLEQTQSHKSDCEIDVSYLGAPYYRVHVRGPDYKSVEGALRDAADAGLDHLKSRGGDGEFHRELKKT